MSETANPWILYSERQPKDSHHYWVWLSIGRGDWSDATYCSDPAWLAEVEQASPFWQFEYGRTSVSGVSHWAPYWLDDLTGQPEAEMAKAPFPPNSPEMG
jgi:hypothetical protein